MVASERIKAAGIPGIKYKDQGSRGGGGGTHNYVVFDDSIIKILRKYGLPLTAGTAAFLSDIAGSPGVANATEADRALKGARAIREGRGP